MSSTLLPLLVALVVMATRALAAFDYGTVPPTMWANSRYTVRAATSQAAAAGGGDRLVLDCGAVAAVTPAQGFSLSQGTTFDFTINTGASAVSGDCVFTRTGEWYGSEETMTTAVTVQPQRTLTVSPASTVDSPIVIGTTGAAALTFTLSDDLGSEPQVRVVCSGLASSSASSFNMVMVSGPGSVEIRGGNSVGLAECRYEVVNTVAGAEELAVPPPSFIKVVPFAKLVATYNGAAANPNMADSLAPLTEYTLSVAPPSALNFGLALSCTNVDMTVPSVTFTDASADAQVLKFVTRAAPAAGTGVSVYCGWVGSDEAYTKKIVDVPGELNWYIGDDVVVTSSADSLQINAANSWRTTVTVTAPPGTVFVEGIYLRAKCSAGSMSPDELVLSNSALAVTTTYYAEPSVGIASAPTCMLTASPRGDYRRLKTAVADLTFAVDGQVEPIQLRAYDLPTPNDRVDAEPAGVIGWAAAAEGVDITLGIPAEMPADVTATIGLACSAPTYGAIVTVTPASATITVNDWSPMFSIVVTRADPATPNALNDLVSCTWALLAGDATKVTVPIAFSFVVGEAVQLEVRQDLSATSPFSGVVQGQTASYYLQSAGEQAALVGGSFWLTASCGPCGSGTHTGEGYVQDSSWQVSLDAFPRLAQNDKVFVAQSPGVVTCHWSFPPGYAWARAFLLPAPTVITILPLPVATPVMGVPAANDVIPSVSGEGYYFFPQPAAPGQVFTISMPAAPTDAVFGSTSNTFNLVCSGAAVVSNNGLFFYSEASRGAKSQTLTMPQLIDGQPIEIGCSFVPGYDNLGPLSLFTGDARPRFQLAVVATPAVLTPMLAETAPLFTGGQASVVLDSSLTVRPIGQLQVDVACAMSTPVADIAVSTIGIGVLLQPGRVQGSTFTFRFRAGDATLTAETTDPALVFGYKFVLPSAPTTLTCTHTLLLTVNGPNVASAGADRALSIAAEPVVITVLTKQTVSVTGAPSAPLGNTPGMQTISVTPTLRDGAVFTDQQTLLVTLSCPGLTMPNGGLMTFTGTGAGAAVIAAQTIELDIPAVNPGAGNVWQCSWLLGGTEALAFQTPAAFDIVVGLVDVWTVEVADPSVSLFVGSKDGQLRAPGSMPAAGTITAECDKDQWLLFKANFGTSSTFSVTTVTLDFGFGSSIVGPLNCRFRLSNMPPGFPLLPPAPLTWTVMPRAALTISGLTSPNFIRIDGGVGANVTIAPTEAPGAGGLLLAMYFDSDTEYLSRSVDRLFWPQGSTAAQSVVLGAENLKSATMAQCNFEIEGDSNMNQFATPASFVVELNTPNRVVVAGLDAHGRLVVASACDDAVVLARPSVAPTADQDSFEIEIYCSGFDSDFISPYSHFFTAANWREQEAFIVRTKGVPLSVRCWASESNNYLTTLEFVVEFASPPVLAVETPTFVPFGGVAPITLRTPPNVFVSAMAPSFLVATCSQGEVSAVALMQEGDKVQITGQAQIDLQYTANGQRPPVYSPDSVRTTRTPVTMAAPRSMLAQTAAAVATNQPLRTNKKEQHEKRQRRAAKTLSMVAAAGAGVGAVAAADELVTCKWRVETGYSNKQDETRFSLQPSSTFVVGTPVDMPAQLLDGAVTAMLGQEAWLVVTPTVAPAVDVIVDVVCTAGVSTTEPAFTLAANLKDGVSTAIILTVAADAALGAASCTLTPSGAGRLAVSSPATVAFTIEAVPEAPSSTAGDSTASDSSSSGGDAAGPDSGSTAGDSSSDSASSASTADESAADGSTSSADDSTGATSISSSSTGASATSSSSSSTGNGDGDGAPASSSSSGPNPCGDFECGAFSAASLPGLAALAVMMMAAAFAQRQ